MSLSHSLLLKILALPNVGNKRAMQIASELIAREITEPTDLELYEFANELLQGKACFTSSEERNAWPSIANRILEESVQKNITVLSYFDESYPESLKNISDHPVMLYAMGNLSAFKVQPAIAVIGTRSPTDWGYRSGERIAMNLAEAGINIVSGLAMGCDMAGHIGALKAKGTTTAVLAHGLQGIYPTANKPLAERILAEGGLLLSEYPIGTQPHKGYFVQRDRLQAGLSLGTFVIETDVEGGSIYTMEYTLKYGRKLMCLSHPDALLQELKVQGNQKYLKEGKAVAIVSKKDVDQLIESIHLGALSLSNAPISSAQQISLL